jgi:hypothetical protein
MRILAFCLGDGTRDRNMAKGRKGTAATPFQSKISFDLRNDYTDSIIDSKRIIQEDLVASRALMVVELLAQKPAIHRP